MSYLIYGFVIFITMYFAMFFLLISIMHRKIFNKRIDYVNSGGLFSEVNQKSVFFDNSDKKNDSFFRFGIFFYPKSPKNINENNHLIILVCGYEESYLDFKSEIFFWIENGYTVFCYDIKGTGKSTGKLIGGFTQFLEDSLLAIEYIEKNEKFNKVSLIGHSMGGFAVATSLKFKKNFIDNSVVISGFDYPSEFVRKSIASNFHIFFTWPIEITIKIIEFLKFGKLSFNKSIKSINNFNKPVLIIQSIDDMVVKISNSIYEKKEKITNKNVEYILLKNSDHNPTKNITGGLNIDLMNKINEFISNN